MSKKKHVVPKPVPKEKKEKEVTFDSDNPGGEAPVVAAALQEWAEPFPTEGSVRVLFLQDAGLSEVVGGNGRLVQFKKGDVVVIDAAHAQSMHKFLGRAP